jgi:branched-chain amino acid transport system permease protein
VTVKTTRSFISGFGLVGLLVAFALIPGIGGDVKVKVLTLGSMCSLSAYLPLRTGQLSLASPAFYLIGGYATGMVSVLWVSLDPETGYWKLPLGFTTLTFTSELFPWQLVILELILGAVVAAVFGLLVGLLALRLQGIYLALVTIGFVEVIRLVVQQDQLGPFKGPLDPSDPTRYFGPFGGATGLPGTLRSDGMPQPVDVDPTYLPRSFGRFFSNYLYWAIPLLVLCAFVVYRMERGRTGRALSAIREDELAASAMGIRPKRYKLLAFVMSAVIASLAGTLYAHAQNIVSWRQATFELAAAMLAGAVVGGSRTFLGPIFGGALIAGLFEVLRAIAGIDGLAPAARNVLINVSPFIQGLVMVLVCVFLSRGLIPPKLVEWLFPKDGTGPPPPPTVDNVPIADMTSAPPTVVTV